MLAIPWSSERMLELGRRHALLEAQRKLDPLMETLVENPLYEFYPLGLQMSGGDRVRRYYQQFFLDFMEKITGYTLLDEWVNERAVTQEYDIVVDVGGTVETHRVIGILYAEGELLGGERIYGSERIVRLMTGRMFGELSPI